MEIKMTETEEAMKKAIEEKEMAKKMVQHLDFRIKDYQKRRRDGKKYLKTALQKIDQLAIKKRPRPGKNGTQE